MKLSSRALTALEHLEAGAEVYYKFDKDFSGGSYCMKHKGLPVNGFGNATLAELREAGYLQQVSTQYIFKAKRQTPLTF